MKLKLLLYICLVLTFYSEGQEQSSKFRHITSKNGLSQSSISCILKDSRGFMWFGTEDGLNKFDGKKMTVYRHLPNDNKSLSSSYVNTIIEDVKGFLWIGTKNGLNYFDPNTEKFTRYLLQSKSESNSRYREIISLVKINEGTLMVGTADGLYVFDKKNGFTKVKLENDGGSIIVAMSQDVQGYIWILTFDGNLHRIKVEDGKLGVPKLQRKFDKTACYTMHLDASNMWIGTGKGLLKFHAKTKATKNFSFYPLEDSVFKKNSVYTIIAGETNMLIVGSHEGGLIRFDTVTEKHQIVLQDPNNLFGLNSNSVRSLLKTKDNILWVGTLGGGINKYDPNHFKFEHLKYFSKDKKNLNQNIVRSILVDSDNELWVGTQDGLNRIARNTNELNSYRYDSKNEQSISQNTIRSLAEDSNGIIWAGTWGNGLNSFDKKTNTFKRYKKVHELKGTNYPVRALKVDQNNNIWIGGTGLVKLNQKTNTYTRYFTNKDTSYAVHNLFIDKDGILWVGTYQNGLIRLDITSGESIKYMHDPNDSTSLSYNYITSIVEDSNKDLWIGTYGGGINIFKKATKTFIRHNTGNGLQNDVIYGILIDKSDIVWHTSNTGLARYDSDLDVLKYFGIEHGIQSEEFNAGAFFKSQKGEFFFGGINGFNSFFPNTIFSKKEASEIVFTDFRLLDDGNKETIGLLEKHISQTKNIELKYNQNTISLDFAELNYSENSYNSYEYQLEGFEKKWNLLGKKQQITLGNLRPGKYTLKVRVLDNRTKQTTINISILPAIWQTRWAYLAYLIMLFLIGGYIYRSMKKTSRIRQDFEQKIKNWEKTNGANHNLNQKERLTTLMLKKVKTTSMNQKFLEGAIKVVEENIENSDFDVERFADQMYVSRSQLHRKLKSQAGYSATEFIRLIRLKRAAQLLTGNVGTISEIAYKVGFENVGYFSKCFRETFAKTPSQYSQEVKSSHKIDTIL